MAIEYMMLALSVALVFAVIVFHAASAVAQYGAGRLAGPRDNLDPPNAFVARAKRTAENHKEGLLLFAPLVLLAGQMNAFDGLSALGAQLFFYSRLAHAAVYILGLPLIRPLIFSVGVAGLALIFTSLFN